MLIEVVYAASYKESSQLIIKIKVPEDISIQQAIVQSGILDQYQEIDLKINKVGIWGNILALSTPVKDGDRVEIYRALPSAPNQTRLSKINKK